MSKSSVSRLWSAAAACNQSKNDSRYHRCVFTSCWNCSSGSLWSWMEQNKIIVIFVTYHSLSNTITNTLLHWLRQGTEVVRMGGGKVEEVWGHKSPIEVQGRSAGRGLEQSPQKPKNIHNMNFALRFPLLNACHPFYSSYNIMFVIGFSISSHISDFESLPYLSPTPILCVHMSYQIYANLRFESTASWPVPPVATLILHSNALLYVHI